MSATRSWTPADVPDLADRRALVTGATAPLAERLVTELAGHGAEVILAAADPGRLADSIRRVRAEVPEARLSPLTLDACDLPSVRRAAALVSGTLNLLVHAADAPPGTVPGAPTRTADGLEPRMAAHVFGPFALTGLLFPRLVASGDGRVVTLTSPAARLVRRPPLEDPFEPSRRDGAPRSRLGALMFALELDQRAREQKVPVRALSAHGGLASGLPGAEDTTTGPARMRLTSTIGAAVAAATRQPDELAAQPVLMASTADLPGSTLVGPDGVGQLRGAPRILGVGRLARDAAARSRLWQICEEVTAVRFLGG